MGSGRHGRTVVAASVTVVAAVAAALVIALVIAEAGRSPTGGKPSAVHPLAALDAPQPSSSLSPLSPPPTNDRPHERVAAAAPTRFLIKGPAFSVAADMCAMPAVFPLDPPGDQLHTVCWVQRGFGVAPASTTRGTTYVLGHAWALQELVLNPVSEFATAHMGKPTYSPGHIATYGVPALEGYDIVLTTPNGTLGYRVDEAYLVGKLDARGVPSLMNTRAPNRLVLITCAVHGGVDLPQNVILYATLTWSKAARTAG